jgi:hypothetical protein
MKSKGHRYIYIHQVFGKSQIIFLYINNYLLQHTGEELYVPRTVIVFGLDKAKEVIGRCEFMSGIICATGQCFMFHFINRKVLAQMFHVKIGQMTLQQCHSIGHCRRNHQDGGIIMLGQRFAELVPVTTLGPSSRPQQQ